MTQRADLVLEDGGVKGLGLVGAVAAFAEAGYTFPRVAGTSAGAITGAVVAAMQKAGEPLTRLPEIARTLDYRRLRDRSPLARLVGPLRPVADGLSLAFESGIFEGEYLRSWLAGVLKDLDVVTFGDLRLPEDPGTSLAAEHRYRLVVTASDLSRRRLVRLPWDYPDYGLDADSRVVADAVRASAAIPFFYEPTTLRSPDGSVSTLVDGGLLSNFPIGLFDRTDDRPPRWPTFGVRLSARPGKTPHTQAVRGPVSLALAVVETTIEACDARHIDDPCVQARTVFVDTSSVSAVDFGIDAAQQQALLETGYEAARRFLVSWDWPTYLRRCRPENEPRKREE